MAITASLVKELREKTGAGMMDCKKALTEMDGDLEKAVEYLKIKGLSKADKKADRVAAEGLVGASVAADGQQAALVEVNCETDFVARNDEFIAFVNDLVAHVATTGVSDRDALLASELGGQSVEDIRKAKVASIGENISVRRAALLSVDGQGIVAEYIHAGGTIGVLVALKSDRDLRGNESVAELGRDVAMHVAATNPAFLQESDIDEETVANEKHVLTQQALESGKPPEIVEKMIEGRIRKWRKEICLVDQPFVKNPDLSIAAEVKRVSKEAGVPLSITGFVRFACGEGIEKKESNLADEVAATLR